MPSPVAKRRFYWQAVHALREAESIAKLGNVTGPADSPPKEGEDEDGWIASWKKRAKATLKKAYDWWSSGDEKLKDRARGVGKRIREGIEAIKKANPLGAAAKKIDDLQSAANMFSAAWFGGSVVATAILLWAAYELFFKKGS